VADVDILLLDLASLRYRWSDDAHRSLAVLSAMGEVLAVVDCEAGLPQREAAFRACDAALASGRVVRASQDDLLVRRRCRIGLYNPYSGEVAVGPVSRGTVYQGGGRLDVPPNGVTLQMVDGRLEGDGITLEPVESGYAEMRHAHSAHQV
jgi:hypothetical protein